MKRRDFFSLAGAAMITSPGAAHAQQASLPVVGILSAASLDVLQYNLPSFLKGLGEAGFIDGRNVAIAFALADGDNRKLPDLAANLVRQKVAAIASLGNLATAIAAKDATRTIPVVFAIGADAVASGLVPRLSRPGGNLTGNTQMNEDTNGKRLELLKEIAPRARKFAVLGNPTNPAADRSFQGLEAVLRAWRFEALRLNASNAEEVGQAFNAIAAWRADALFVHPEITFQTMQEQIVGLAVRNAIPAVYSVANFVRVGGLMSYGPDQKDLYRHAGLYVGRVLKGENPGDLPVVQPTKFELAVNLKTAKAIGLNIPESFLVRADLVIE